MSGQNRIIKHFPHFFQTDDTENLFYRFVEVFGSMLDAAEDDMIRVMRAHWVETADNEGSKGFDTNQKGDLDKIFSLYIEALGGTSLLKQIGRREGADGIEDDKVYRKRIKGLIQILKNGASTREGIVAIVAANLGIYGDEPRADAARARIGIIEYLPREVTKTVTAVDLNEVFAVTNPNPDITDLAVRITSAFPQQFPLRHIVFEQVGSSFKQVDSSFKMEWTGPADVDAGPDKGQILIDISGKQVRIFQMPPGTDIVSLTGSFNISKGGLKLPPGISQWRIGFLVGEFGATTGENVTDNPNRFFNQKEAIFAPSGPLFTVAFTFIKLQPATFMVQIPWDIHIPDYPELLELLDKQADNPRFQIPYIVNRVKAAGVWAVVAYYKEFPETHKMIESFGTKIDDPAYPDNQTMSDSLNFGGVFNATYFGQSLFQHK